MLIALSKALDTPVSTLLGETIAEPEAGDLKAISAKLEVVNLQLAQIKHNRRRALHGLFLFLGAAIVILFAVLAAFQSSYLGWDYGKVENAVMGVGVHAFEWLFVRVAPFVLTAAVVGAVFTRKRE